MDASRFESLRADTPRLTFVVHLAVYLVFSVIFVLLDYLINDEGVKPGRITWAHWPILGWGIGVLSHAVVVFCLLDRLAKRDEAASPAEIVIHSA